MLIWLHREASDFVRGLNSNITTWLYRDMICNCKSRESEKFFNTASSGVSSGIINESTQFNEKNVSERADEFMMKPPSSCVKRYFISLRIWDTRHKNKIPCIKLPYNDNYKTKTNFFQIISLPDCIIIIFTARFIACLLHPHYFFYNYM